MTMKYVHSLLFMASMAMGIVANAQRGIRYGIQYESVTQAKPGTRWHMVLGYDFDLADRLSGGIDVSTDTQWSSEFNTYVIPRSGLDFSEKIKMFGVVYRSQYHFADNDGGGTFYLGPTLGVRSVKQSLRYSEEIPGIWYNTIQERETKESKLLFPLGMRIGVRGPLDGGYYDIYLAMGTNLGAGDVPINDVAILTGESLPNKLFFQTGFAYGVGW